MGALKVRDPITGLWVYAGIPGPAGLAGETGATGASGPAGQSTVMVAEFSTRTPADLPVDGVIPPDWDGSGTFVGGMTMTIGESLINNNPADADFTYLHTFVDTGDPTGWIRVGQVVGPAGIQGATGPSGPQGEVGPDEVYVGPTAPTGGGPTDIWYDPSVPDPPPIGLDTVAVVKANVLSHTFLGPWAETNANAVWTVDLAPGTYMCVFNVTSMTATTGGRGVNIWIDGVKSNLQSYLWFNEVNAHRAMNTDIEILTFDGGPVTLWSKDNGSCLGDSNDRGMLFLIPCDPA